MAATPIDPRVADCHRAAMTAHAANAASSEHAAGAAAALQEERARASIAETFGREPDEVIFTPGASAALWLAVEDVALGVIGRAARVAAAGAEHPALLSALREAERAGRVRVELVGVDDTGTVRPELLERAVAGGADLVCAMAANNETGAVTPLYPVVAIARRAGARLLIDASQAAGRLELDTISRADLVVVSGAKIYGPRRMGALVGRVSASARLRAHDLFGSPDPAAAEALAFALALRTEERLHDEARIGALRDALQEMLLSRVPGLSVNGGAARLAGCLHVSTPHLPGEAAVARLWGRVAVSTGSACRSGVPGPSHVLRAMPVPDWVREGAVRIGLGRFTTGAEVEAAGAMLADALGATDGARRSA